MPADAMLYGLQRSGTNLLRTLIRRYYQVTLHNRPDDRTSPRHKHVRLYPEPEKCADRKYHGAPVLPAITLLDACMPVKIGAYVIIVKDPFAWWLSYRRWATRQRWPDVPYHTIQEWNAFHRYWLTMRRQCRRVHLVRYESLIDDPAATMQDLARRAHWTPNDDGTPITLPTKVSVSQRFDERRRRYYLKRRYLEDMNETERENVVRQLDQQVAMALGYTHYSGGVDL